jgi:zinc protease
MTDVASIARVEVGGVPVFSLDVPGPMRAMLAFRVGAVDETLPTRGITHLVEHLAMYPLMQAGSRHAQDRLNARVEPVRTRFFAAGSAEEIKAFLADLCQSLTNLAVERLENEKKILRTEAANSERGSAKGGWSWRFGPNGLGLLDWAEYGLRWLGPDHVAHWARTNFTAENAVLVLTGPVPAGLELKLPGGRRMPLPDQRALAYKTPAIFQIGDRFVLLSILGPRATPFVTARDVLNARLRDRVRVRESLAYNVNAEYHPLDRTTAEIAMFADSLRPSSRAAADAFVEEVNRLAKEGPTAAEIAMFREERRVGLADPESGVGRLDQIALAELEGREGKSLEELEADFESDSPGDIAQVVKTASGTAFLGIPEEVPMTVPGFTPVPAGSGKPITGHRVFPMPGAKHSDILDYSSGGVSLTAPNGTVVGMRWDEVAAALWWQDGRRRLVNFEGAGINVTPDRWREVRPLLDAIRANVPAERWVPMDEEGSLPRHEGPICSICEAAPAIEVTLQDPRSLFLVYRRKVHGVLCRDCGIAKFRQVQRRVLALGWWSIPGLIITPIALISNIEIWSRFRRLPVPIRTSGINPLPKGHTVWLHPAMLIPLSALVGLAVIYIRL